MYDEHAESVFRFLLYRTGDRALSEDLLADTFEKVLRSRGRSPRRPGTEKPWLYAIALNCLRDGARRGQVERRALERYAAEPVPHYGQDAGAVESADATDRLREALAGLADEEREALGLRFGGDLSVPEIAQLLGLPVTTVEGRVYRGLRKLRGRLASSEAG
jgi:RNA polymerase sigma-70 factor (ECF subfamily)